MALHQWRRGWHAILMVKALSFSKFDRLAARSLLYQRCEILELQAKLDLIDKENQCSQDPTMADIARSWEGLLQEMNSEDNIRREWARELMALIFELRAKMREYQEALWLQNQISSFRAPGTHAISAFRQWLVGPHDPSTPRRPHCVLGGKVKFMLDEETGLVSLHVPSDTDTLSRFLRRFWPKQVVYDGPHGRLGLLENRTIRRAAVVINTVTAAMLLIGSIVSLYFVHSSGARLGIIAAFTIAFALCVALMTKARTVEIFGATAAYAAVLVVFVGSGIN